MAPFLDITKLTFGSDDAELDEKRGFLDKVFLKTSIYERIKRSERELVIGRKGSGKSAICLMLKKAFASERIPVVLLTPLSISQTKLQELKVTDVSRDESYVLSWKYALLMAMGREVLSQIRTPKLTPPDQTVRTVRKFLVENSEIEATAFERVFARGRGISKVSVKAFGVEGSVEARQAVLKADLISALERYSTAIRELMRRSGEISVIILIDKIDEIWDQSEASQLMLIGLLKAAHHLNAAFPNVSIVVFLRSDIYKMLRFSDADKFHSLEQRISWNARDLKRLVANRGRISLGWDATDIDQIWDAIFDPVVNGDPSFVYMLSRTMMRPRELIQFCNNSLNEALDSQHERIEAEDILNAELQYSEWKVVDLISEFLVQYPFLKSLLNLFYGYQSVFTPLEFETHYQEIKEDLVKHYASPSLTTSSTLQLLFSIGFLGVRRDSGDVFEFHNPKLILNQEDLLVVHPAFHAAMDIRSTPKEDLQQVFHIDLEALIDATGNTQYSPNLGDNSNLTDIEHLAIEQATAAEINMLGKQIIIAVERIAELQRIKGQIGENPHLSREIEDLEHEITETRKRIQILWNQDSPIKHTLSAISPLTNRERQILTALAEGYSTNEIAESLSIQYGTVKMHVHHIIDKLGAKNRTQAVKTALSYGWITRSDNDQ